MVRNSRRLLSSSTTRTRSTIELDHLRGEEKGEGRAGTPVGLHPDLAAVFLGDAVDDGQAETGPVRLRREEGLEETRPVGVGDSHAGVVDGDLHRARVRQGPHPRSELSPVRHRLYRVETEVPDRLPDLPGIDRGLDRTLREIPGDSDRGGRPVGEEEEDLLDDVDQIGLDPNDALGSREIEEVPDDTVETIGLPENDVHEPTIVALGLEALAQDLDRSPDGADRIADFVREAGREAA